MPTEPLTNQLASRRRHEGFDLEVVSGPDAGQKHSIDARAVVGSGSDASVQLTDPAVSRQHIEISVDAVGAHVVDLGSTNGTLLANVRTESFRVHDEATFRVGRTVLRLKARAASEPSDVERFGDALTVSEPMRRVFSSLRQAARTNVSVLLSGETGTGKEVLAHGLHQVSPRHKAPFVVVDCASLGRDVIESELFGHVRGSFSGAVNNRVGLLLQADKGTVFLDEIGELPLELQTRFLRVLVDGQVRAIGSDKPVHVDLRVVAASHRDLRAMADAGQFRADLYYRLAGVVIEIPPLRERPGDLELLFSALMDKEGHGDFVPSGELRAHLHSHRWPGNVRELKNFVQQVISGTAPGLAPIAEQPEPATFKTAKEAMLSVFTRQYFTQLYERCGGNVSEVARVSGLARPWVHQLITKLGIHETRPKE